MTLRILLTGISGFLGAEIARRLVADGASVAALVRPGSSMEPVSDIAESLAVHVHDGGTSSLVDILAAFAPDQVIHLASRFIAEHASADVEDLVRSNVLFPTQLMEAMQRCGCRQLVNTGTSWQHFGGGAEYRPVNLYAATKQAFEDVLRYYGDAHGFSHITLKLFDTYGERDQRRKLIRLLIDAARTGARLDLSPGEQVIDLVHADDVVDAFVLASRRLAAAPAPLAESFLVPGERLTLSQLVGRLERAVGRPIDVGWGARPYRAREVMMPVAPQGHTLPGWRAKVSLDDGLRRLAANGDGIIA